MRPGEPERPGAFLTQAMQGGVFFQHIEFRVKHGVQVNPLTIPLRLFPLKIAALAQPGKHASP